MAHTEILLLKPVDGLGGEGDQVKVRAGYARNFLLPQKFAASLTKANKKQVEALKKRRAEREASEYSSAQELAKKIEKTSLAFAVKTGEGGKMFTFAYDLGGGGDAPSYVAVNALTHDGKMYVVHATSPGGKTAAKDLRANADSFRVG